jgi:hypothetical protein
MAMGLRVRTLPKLPRAPPGDERECERRVTVLVRTVHKAKGPQVARIIRAADLGPGRRNAGAASELPRQCVAVAACPSSRAAIRSR